MKGSGYILCKEENLATNRVIILHQFVNLSRMPGNIKKPAGKKLLALSSYRLPEAFPN
jgi:hypothetical protein